MPSASITCQARVISLAFGEYVRISASFALGLSGVRGPASSLPGNRVRIRAGRPERQAGRTFGAATAGQRFRCS